MGEKSKLRQSISRWANPSRAQAEGALKAASRSGNIAIAEAPDREPVTVTGTLRTVTLRPRGGVPALEAELYDGTGTITLLWLGRRRIAGIKPGCSITVSGRIGVQDESRVLYNPRYSLGY